MPDFKKFFKKTSVSQTEEQAPEVPKGLWVKCPKCSEMVYKMWWRTIMSVRNAVDIFESRLRPG